MQEYRRYFLFFRNQYNIKVNSIVDIKSILGFERYGVRPPWTEFFSCFIDLNEVKLQV